MLATTDKSHNRNALFLELREQVRGIAPVGGNRSIATGLAANRTVRPKEGVKINLAGEKRLLVFPNRLKCVRKGKLNLSAPCPRGGRRRAAQTFGTASLRDLVILPRSISYPAISPSLIPSVKLPCKFSSPLLHYIVGNNTGPGRQWPCIVRVTSYGLINIQATFFQASVPLRASKVMAWSALSATRAVRPMSLSIS